MGWHGCLIVLAALAGTEPIGAEHAIPVRARVFDIDYAVNAAAEPLESVELWYTADRGHTWHLHGRDSDSQSPASFAAPAEGLFGFYVVMANAAGASSEPPSSTTQPFCWAFVDYTPPVVQLHALRQSRVLGRRALMLRWTAIDTHLRSRPVEISYRKPPDDVWYPVMPDPVANTGRFDWRLPDELMGPVEVRIAVSDKGGHRVESEAASIELTKLAAHDESAIHQGGDDGDVEAQPNDAARRKADKLFQQGLDLRDQGDRKAAIARMRQAVRFDPNMTAGFAEMAAMLYALDDHDQALRAYEIVLDRTPKDRTALRGAAMVLRKKNNYAASAARLRDILRNNPKDAEVWMNLGDVAIFQGDEMVARQSYTRAIEVDPRADDVIQKARERLALMAKVSRSYQQ